MVQIDTFNKDKYSHDVLNAYSNMKPAKVVYPHIASGPTNTIKQGLGFPVGQNVDLKVKILNVGLQEKARGRQETLTLKNCAVADNTGLIRYFFCTNYWSSLFGMK